MNPAVGIAKIKNLSPETGWRQGYLLFFLCELQKALTSPDADNPDFAFLPYIYTPKWRVYYLTQLFQSELWNHTPHCRIISELFSLFDYTSNNTFASLRHSLLIIVFQQTFKVRGCRFRKSKGKLRRHSLLNTETFFYIFETNFPTLFQVNKPLSNCLHKFPFLLCRFEVMKRLYNSYPSASAGKQDGTVRIRRLLYYLAGIDFQISDRNNILGKFHTH